MANFRDTFDKLPENVRNEIERLRKNYKEYSYDYDGYHDKITAREKSLAYCRGLRDAGLITERERMMIFIYTTV